MIEFTIPHVLRWIDGHLDLAYLELGGRDLREHVRNTQEGCISLPALREAGIEIVFGTIFTEPGIDAAKFPHGYQSSDDSAGAEAAGLRQVAVYQKWEAAGEVSIVRSPADVERPSPVPKIVLLMEGADPIRSPDHLRAWFDRGVRIVGLTWAAGTRYAGGNSSTPGSGPLTSQGAEMIHALDELGIVHDASHLSDAAFDGLMAHAKGLVIASHSNCRSLVEPKQRHLRADQIKTIAERGGMVGLNLYSPFLIKGRRATIDDCIAHVEHIADVMGHRRGISLGSDMDGGFTPKDLPIGLDHPGHLHSLSQALRDRGWPDADIRGFAFENWSRFLDAALPSH